MARAGKDKPENFKLNAVANVVMKKDVATSGKTYIYIYLFIFMPPGGQ